jgi:hypothetical protein
MQLCARILGIRQAHPATVLRVSAICPASSPLLSPPDPAKREKPRRTRPTGKLVSPSDASRRGFKRSLRFFEVGSAFGGSPLALVPRLLEGKSAWAPVPRRLAPSEVIYSIELNHIPLNRYNQPRFYANFPGRTLFLSPKTQPATSRAPNIDNPIA